LKSDAGKAVKGIEGVTLVDNQIEVLPTSIEDGRIRRAEYRAIYSFPTLQMSKNEFYATHPTSKEIIARVNVAGAAAGA
jgi:hypothetical protein